MKNKILAFTGRKQSGKNTCCNVIIGWEMLSLRLTSHFKISQEGGLWVSDILGDLNNEGIFDVTSRSNAVQQFLKNNLDPFVKLYSFADPLKRVVCHEVLGVPYEQCFGTDEQKNMPTHLVWDKVDPNKTGNMTAREVMQFVGTDIFRNIYSNVWVDATIRKIQEETPELALICDCRFPNEVSGIQDAGGKVIRLTRNSGSDDCHSSETALDEANYDWSNFDAVIDNAGMSLAEQNKAVYDLLAEWGWLEFDVTEGTEKL